MKSEWGVSLVELVVVIIIIVLIATFAVLNGRDTLDKTDALEVYAEMNAVKESVNSVMAKQNMEDDFALEAGKYYDMEFAPVPEYTASEVYGTNVLNHQADWYIILGKEETQEDAIARYNDSEVRTYLGLDAINHTYIVNYTTGEVELYRPTTILNTTVRTYDEVRALVSNS